VLRHFAHIAGANLRDVDVFGRYGGEEFLMILPGTGRSGAWSTAERVRASVAGCEVPGLPPDRRITVTVGIATASAGQDIEDLLASADRALYQGKAAGRNRVVAVG
jgi:diguanylate cyclase (GGDEF)-like protein